MQYNLSFLLSTLGNKLLPLLCMETVQKFLIENARIEAIFATARSTRAGEQGLQKTVKQVVLVIELGNCSDLFINQWH